MALHRIRLGGVAAALVAVVLAGCSSATPEAATASAEPSPSVVPVESVAAGSLPAGDPPATGAADPCPATAWVPSSEAEGAIGGAAGRARLPHGASLLSAQVIGSTAEPAMLEAVMRVCSEGLTEAALIDVANEIAIAIRAHPASDALAVLVVSSSTFDARSREVVQGESVRADFQMFAWDRRVPVPMASNWE